jgi:hypothetical protein
LYLFIQVSLVCIAILWSEPSRNPCLSGRARNPIQKRLKKGATRKSEMPCAKDQAQGISNLTRDSLAVFTVEQVVLNRHADFQRRIPPDRLSEQSHYATATDATATDATATDATARKAKCPAPSSARRWKNPRLFSAFLKWSNLP